MLSEIFGGLRYTLRSMFITYNFYHPELHLGGCVLKYARRQYPELMQAPMTTDNVITIVRTMYAQLTGYVQEMIDDNRQEVQAQRERIGAKVADLTAPSSENESNAVPQFTPIQAPTPLPVIQHPGPYHQQNNNQPSAHPFQIPQAPLPATAAAAPPLKYRSIRRSATGDILEAEFDEGVEEFQRPPSAMEINAFVASNNVVTSSDAMRNYYHRPSSSDEATIRQQYLRQNDFNGAARQFPSSAFFNRNLNSKPYRKREIAPIMVGTDGRRQVIMSDLTIEQLQHQQLGVVSTANDKQWDTSSATHMNVQKTPYMDMGDETNIVNNAVDKDDTSFANDISMTTTTSNHIDDDDNDGVVMEDDGGVADAISAGSGEDAIKVPSTLFDFENIILESFGFNAKEVKSFSLSRCAQSYVLNIMWRMLEGYLG